MNDQRKETLSNFHSYKIVVLGSGAVGKSCLTCKFIMNSFNEEYIPTLQDTFRKNFQVDGKIASIEILDTAGMEEYIVMQELWIKDGHGFILVFAVNYQESLKELRSIYQKIQNVKKFQKFPIMLVGNKIDLEDQRKVSSEEAMAFAKEFGCTYIETSAKTGHNVNKLFEDLVRQIRENEQPKLNANSQQSKDKKKKNFFDKYCSLI